MDPLRPGLLAAAVVTVAIELTEVVTVTDTGRMLVMSRRLAHQLLGNIKLLPLQVLLQQEVKLVMATVATRPFRHTKTWVPLLASVDLLLHQESEACINAMLEVARHRHRPLQVMDHPLP